MDILTLQVVAIIFLSTFVRGLTGFGNALVAMPLLALVLRLEVATPLVALTAVIMATLMLGGNWRQVEVGSAWRLLLASVPGVFIGLWLLRTMDERPIRIGLALLILAYSAYDLGRPRLARLRSNRWAYLAGFLAGLVGGACNANGPPIVVYGTMRGWNPSQFRATLQGFFLPAGLFILAGHAAAGFWTPEVLRLLLYSLPAVGLGLFLGSLLAKRIHREHFRVLVHVVLIVSALLLLGKSLA